MSGNAAGRDTTDPAAVEAAVGALSAGRAVVLPTDTVYGVAVLLATPDAGRILSALKGRPEQQPLAVLVASAEQARSLIEPPSSSAQRLMATFWPGRLTLVLRRRADLQAVELGGDGATIGVRWPNHPLIWELAGRLGPLVTTSANRHGRPTPRTAAEAAAGLTGAVGATIPGGVLGGPPSSVVDCTTDEARLLREGAVTAAQVEAAVAGDAR